MKAIILISSIFYLLGLKLSNKIDLIKPAAHSVSKVIVHKPSESEAGKTINLNEAQAIKPAKDSVQGGGTTDQVLQYK